MLPKAKGFNAKVKIVTNKFAGMSGLYNNSLGEQTKLKNEQ